MEMFTDFSSWWEALSIFERIYWMIAIPTTFMFLVQLVLTFVGGDGHEAGDDFDHDFDAGDLSADFHFLTIKNLIAFFAIFSWSGLACIDARLGIGLTIFISITCGLIMMLIMASIHYFMSKLSHSGTLNLNNSIGKTGSVYLTIPAKKDGMGKIQIKVQGALRTLNAMTSDLEDIKTGSIVEVESIINENVLVVKKSR